jgi:hypothetical protein
VGAAAALKLFTLRFFRHLIDNLAGLPAVYAYGL